MHFNVWAQSDALRAHTAPINVCLISQDGSVLATGSGMYGYSDKSIKIWKIPECSVVKRISGCKGGILSMAFSDTNSIAAGCLDNTVKIFSVFTGGLEKNLEGHKTPVRSVFFIHNSEKLVSLSKESVRIWNLSKDTVETEIQRHEKSLKSCAVSQDEKFLALCSYEKTVRIIEISTNRLYEKIQADNHVDSVLFSPWGKYLVFSDIKGFIYFYDLKLHRIMRKIRAGNEPVGIMNFSEAGDFFAAASGKNAVVWKLPLNRAPVILNHDSVVSGIQFSRDGHYLYIAAGIKVIMRQMPYCREITEFLDEAVMLRGQILYQYEEQDIWHDTVTHTVAHIWDIPPIQFITLKGRRLQD